jgi:hypothetical protein
VEYELAAKGRALAALVGEVQRFCARWDGPAGTAPRASAGSGPEPGAARPRRVREEAPSGGPRPAARDAAGGLRARA